jgi:hypothetical protein
MEPSHETHVSEAAVLRLDDSHYVREGAGAFMVWANAAWSALWVGLVN